MSAAITPALHPQVFLCDESINDLHPTAISHIQTPGGSGNPGNFLSTTRYESLDDVRGRLFNLKLQNNRHYTVELPHICHTPLCKPFSAVLLTCTTRSLLAQVSWRWKRCVRVCHVRFSISSSRSSTRPISIPFMNIRRRNGTPSSRLSWPWLAMIYASVRTSNDWSRNLRRPPLPRRSKRPRSIAVIPTKIGHSCWMRSVGSNRISWNYSTKMISLCSYWTRRRIFLTTNTMMEHWIPCHCCRATSTISPKTKTTRTPLVNGHTIWAAPVVRRCWSIKATHRRAAWNIRHRPSYRTSFLNKDTKLCRLHPPWPRWIEVINRNSNEFTDIPPLMPTIHCTPMLDRFSVPCTSFTK